MKNNFMTALGALALLAMAQSAGAQAMDGKTVFANNCAACHMAGGTGIPGAFPALKANKFVLGDADQVIVTVLKGRGGMPTFAESLDDGQLALAVSYIRGAWGNTGAAVSTEQVAGVRSKSNAAGVVKKEQPTNIH
ncbi:c-type cytochrome [Janthinobacterium agaricidamnosum]|uniref:Cytochrome c family protein n=1 Tax=Janthinobacterium agaricidamnosum NBRC 102515 = DSM 9628 TaxID=1349767 RepID=W0V736_9BURK|nr:cytochrome c [Janthinobacterium agaricidamnosum]CDG83696.1 cytochrome c family protein [Janthinobacterium agaricidamnosum NBRC 102515 = DSM 9628]